ncbi:PspC domain-containing protein [Zeaxanthinibacter sp. PT1]|uniref:PspC domain-containing protein n=1 Tax=Zeaxanthinibacter TaxID=561554 RepID=UPI00234A23B0|nr:PspC domain-containing protein [Zeaxanthinibacter sp. PT1]MDC6352233.1 PspC domain-containing protein [Zeaxanthinibacter sp. PT1]
MNKTVNINLANILFHIDEEAYIKLQHYLEAIRRSFSGTPGSDEIIADIEARIAELFQEKMETDRQVITMKEVEQVISVMGQPEDYMVDEDIFEDAPKTERTQPGRIKRLYRDTERKYIGGVCAGLEYYLGIDKLWIRLLFLLLAVFTGFGFIAYILLWILVPEARTTSQKLDMTGEPVNISNIERKVKEGFDDVSERVKNVDYEKVGTKVKNGTRSFFDSLGDLILFVFKVIGKFIGILLIIIGATALIGLFIGMFTVGIADIIHIPGVDFIDMMNSTAAPFWLVSLMIFLAFGIPFFFLLYLGLKILVNNLNSIGRVAKFTLLGLWLLSLITLMVLGIQQASSHAFSSSSSIKKDLFSMGTPDTLIVRMRVNELYDRDGRGMGIDRMKMIFDESGDPLLYSDDVVFNLKVSEDSIIRIHIRKDADGNSVPDARSRAEAISYSYDQMGNLLILDDHLLTDPSNKVRDQEVTTTVYIPEGTILQLDNSTRGHIGRGTRYDRDFYRSKMIGHYWQMDDDGELKCLDCPEEEYPADREDGENNKIKINEDGIDIKLEDETDSFELKINEEGVRMRTN